MNGVSSEALFWGGIFVIIAAVLLLLICCVVFHITGKRIQKILEEEYGKL